MTDDLTDIDGVGPAIADELESAGYETVEDVMTASADELADVHMLGESSAKAIRENNGGGGRGQPTLFTAERRDQIIQRAKLGATLEGCARAAGISYRTLRNWLDKGEQRDDLDDDYVQFFQAFNRARASGEERLLQATAQDDPKFILQSSYGYVKTDRKEVDMDADVDVDASHDVTAEFVTYAPEDQDGDE